MSTYFQDTDLAEVYVKFRPVAPHTVFETIVQYCKDGGADFGLAIDVGCGSGQSTLPLAEYYNSVIGVDVSESMIAQAPQDTNGVSYRVGSAECLPFQSDGTVDLITSSMALHWFNVDTFYKEVKRVLKPHGVLCCYGYDIPQLQNSDANLVMQKYYHDSLKGGGHCDDRVELLDNHYSQFTFPMADFKRCDLSMEKRTRLSDFVGYLKTWSPYHRMMKQKPDCTALLDLEQRSIYQSIDPDASDPVMEVSWPLFLLLGRKE